MNYAVGDGFTPLSDIMESIQSDKENTTFDDSVGPITVGRAVNSLWGNQTEKRKIARKYYYFGLVSKVQALSREDFPFNPKGPKWTENPICCGQEIEWIYTTLVDGEKVQISVILSDAQIYIRGFGRNVPLNVFGISDSVDIKHRLHCAFTLIQTENFCPGFNTNVDRQRKDKHGNVIGKIESRDHNGDVSLRIRSTKCKVIALTAGRINGDLLCVECSSVKQNTKDPKSVTAKNRQESLMGKDELYSKLQDTKRRLKSARGRELYTKEKLSKLQQDMVVLDNEDNTEFSNMFRTTDESKIPENMKIFWQAQKEALSVSAKGRRWHPKVLRLCLSIYCRSPGAYDDLKCLLVLPSGRTLQRYKNRIKQLPGLNDDIFVVAYKEAKRLNLLPHDKWGGIAIKEITIQSDLQFKKVDGKLKLIGLVELGGFYEDLITLTGDEKDNVEPAKKVLQFIFLGDGGFRFPMAHFPVNNVPPAVLSRHLFRGALLLEQVGFQPYYCVMDGADSNRDLIKLHFPNKDMREKRFTTQNPFTGKDMIFLMDPKHNIKKIRNNLEKSRESGTRNLMFKEGKIRFAYWFNAYKFDVAEHTMPLYHKLKDDHFYLNASSRMRNGLAEAVLNDQMQFLLICYRDYLVQKNGRSVDFLDASIEFLGHTSAYVSLFTNISLAVNDISDDRLVANTKFLSYIDEWNESKTESKSFISDKLYFDLSCSIIAFEAICQKKLRRHPGKGVIPGFVNQDVVENFFCQIRSYNGQNDNPVYAQYGPTVNSIIFGQSLVSSKKRNSDGNRESVSELAFSV